MSSKSGSGYSNSNEAFESSSSQASSKEEEEEVEEEKTGETGEDGEETVQKVLESYKLERYLEMDDTTFEKAHFPKDIAKAVSEMWDSWTCEIGSREARGEAFYTALFDAAPSLQLMFKSPKAVMAMRFVEGLTALVNAMGNPTTLFKEVEALGFRHLDIEITSIRAGFFREALMDTIDDQLGGQVSMPARAGLHCLLNYAGGAFCYIRREYAGRINTIVRSWNVVQKSAMEAYLQEDQNTFGDIEGNEPAENEQKDQKQQKEPEKTEQKAAQLGSADAKDEEVLPDEKEMKVPTTFNEMLLFNASVMGYGASTWMSIVLAQFDDMVRNVANFTRLQEQCDVMSLVLAKYKGKILLTEFKAVTLASLRSLLPQDWDSEHEVAWGWLWENIEGLLGSMLGKPALQEKALERFLSNLSEEELRKVGSSLFPSFFDLAPAGQDFLKQSATRINFIGDKVVAMTLEMYRTPRHMVETLSALGLRHVGYAIPTEMFPPFVSAAVALLQRHSTDELVVEAFRWSLALIAKILVRSITEGSTLVMKAINTNNKLTLMKAMDVSSRGQRANDLLSITVGTQSISPFYWSIDSGALVCAQTILEDLLTIRADRDVYYYGCDNLFTRHPEVIKRICVSAPSLLPTLLDGLVWRSRQTKEGMRRVNYYVKHLIQDLEGNFSPNLECLVTHGDPNTIRHPTVVLFADILWHKVASFKFVVSKLFSVFILIVFIFGQAVLLRHNTEQAPEEEYAMFACRVVNYVGSLSKLVFSQLRKFFSDLQNRDYRWICGIPVPAYLFNIQDAASCCLMWLLVIMAMQEPFFWCLSDGQGLTQMCQEGEVRKDFYSACTFLAMILYWALLMDLAIFSMRISAYVLVCGRVTGEVALFLSALLLLLLAFSTAISSLYLEMPSKAGALVWLEELTSMSLRMYPQEHYQVLVAASTIITVPVCIFLFIVTIFLMNLLVAQLTQSYHDAFSNMQGYARLNRASVTAVTIANVSRKRWARFIQIMAFDEPMEFNEGDVGLSGGIQVLKPSNEHLVTEDSIKRFGGSTAPTAPWPQTQVPEEEQDKIALLEKKLMKIIKVSSSKHNRGGSTTGSSMSGASGAGTSSAIDSS